MPKRYGEDREVSGKRISPSQLDACYLNPGKEPCQPGFAERVRSSQVVVGQRERSPPASRLAP